MMTEQVDALERVHDTRRGCSTVDAKSARLGRPRSLAVVDTASDPPLAGTLSWSARWAT
jgi:hypothetical protein